MDCNARIENLTAKVRDRIARLKEYQTSLVTTTLTGRIDVREVVDADHVTASMMG